MNLRVRVTQTNHIRDIAARIERTTERGAHVAAERVLDRSQRRVPIDTGELFESGHVEVVSQSPGVVDVIYDAPHAGFVEFGTVKMAAQPYLTPALEAERQRFLDSFRGALD